MSLASTKRNLSANLQIKSNLKGKKMYLMA